MSDKKVVYIVLHYNTFDETVTCMDKLKKLDDAYTVIVCNGSKNDSDKLVYDKYNGAKNVDVLISETNLGFAKGLNVGIKYAKNQLGADFVVCINNDVLIDQVDFSKKVISAYESEKFALCGPDVINPSGHHCNPQYMSVPTIESVTKMLKMYERNLRRCKTFFGLPDMFFCALGRIFPRKTDDSGEKMMAVHGCALIFSKDYLDKYDGLYDGTFLFGEEEILSYRLYKNNMKVAYCPELVVLHNESKSTKDMLKNTAKRHAFYYTHIIESTKRLLEIVKSGKSDF